MRQIEDGLRGQTVTPWVNNIPMFTRSMVLRPNLILQTEPLNRHGIARRLPVLELRWDEVDE
jgi:hypothetical protein